MTMRSQGKRAYAAPAVDRAFEVLEALTAFPDGALMGEIAESVGRTTSELFRVILVMEGAGYLVKLEPTGRYQASSKLLGLAYKATPARRLVDASRDQMHVLALSLRQSCCLVVKSGEDGLVIASCEAAVDGGIAFEVGSRFPLGNTSSGAVLMRSHSEVGSRQRHGACQNDQTTWRDPALDPAQVELRTSTFAYGVIDMSAPLYDPCGKVLAALTISYMLPAPGSDKSGMDAARRCLAAAAGSVTVLLERSATGSDADRTKASRTVSRAQ